MFPVFSYADDGSSGERASCVKVSVLCWIEGGGAAVRYSSCLQKGSINTVPRLTRTRASCWYLPALLVVRERGLLRVVVSRGVVGVMRREKDAGRCEVAARDGEFH